MSTHKSSMTMGTPAKRIMDWMEVPGEELATDLDNTDLAEEAEKCQKEEEERHQREAEAEQKWKDEERKQAAAAEAKKWQQADSGAQWGEPIQAVPTHMDVANSHLERIVSTSQSNSWKMQQHHLLMEGLVGQQQLLVLKLVEMVSAAGSGRAKEVVEDPEEPKELQEMQGEGLGGQEETEGALGEGLGGAPENELGNGLGVEDGAGEENPQEKTQDKGKERAI
ncbi:hypothetical protein ID866_11400 [Astraeus odoratus]|nr:hypothetical protein ID866_11400 [Astraeus odoratus]